MTAARRTPMFGPRLLAVLLPLLTLAPACSGGDAFSDFRGTPEDYHDLAVESVRSPDDVRDAALEHLEDPDPEVRFAAFYALTITAEPGPSMDALAERLGSEDPDERLLASASLVSRGGKDALPVLIAALGSTEVMPRLDPPTETCQYAQFVLTQYTDQDLGLRAAQGAKAAAAVMPAWEKWFAENGAELRWDPAEQRFAG